MARIFISHSADDERLAVQVAAGLEAQGHHAWYFERDSMPGPSYLTQVALAIEQCDAVVLLVSAASIGSTQVTKEVVLAHEQGKPFMPLLVGMSHQEFQTRQPEWRTALGAHASVQVGPGGVAPLLPRLLEGLAYQGLAPGGEPFQRPPTPNSIDLLAPRRRSASAPSAPPAPAGRPRIGPYEVRLDVLFDRHTYPARGDATARFLVEVELAAAPREKPEGVLADIVLILDVSGSMRRHGRFELLRTAVREFLGHIAPTDRVAIILFAEQTALVTGFEFGGRLRQNIDATIDAIDRSPALFGKKTCLADALSMAVRHLRSPASRMDAVRRIYVLTDGKIQDPAECRLPLAEVRQARYEIGAYGLGTDVQVAALRRLLTGQVGGWVKPIVDHEHLVSTFRHIAEVNRRLIAREGRLVVEFKDEIGLGDAWAFRPHEICFGPIARRRNICSLGPIEARRLYSLAFEVRLPDVTSTPTLLADVAFYWQHGGEVSHFKGTVYAGRSHGPSSPIGERQQRVLHAFAALRALRDGGPLRQRLDAELAKLELARLEQRDEALILALAKSVAQLEAEELSLQIDAETARLALAVEEGRDPELIAALEKKLTLLRVRRDGFDVASDVEGDAGAGLTLSAEEVMLIEANWDSAILEDPAESEESLPLESASDDDFLLGRHEDYPGDLGPPRSP